MAKNDSKKFFLGIYSKEIGPPCLKQSHKEAIGFEEDGARNDKGNPVIPEKAAASESSQSIQYSSQLKSIWRQNGEIWPILTAGAGLFSDGYVNSSMSVVNACLSLLYGASYTNTMYARNVNSIVFLGTILGMLIFGFHTDYRSRKEGMLLSTLILVIFTGCCSCAWASDVPQMLGVLTFFRFGVGIGIGGEYPAGAVACSEASNALGRGRRDRWFVIFTTFMIDAGYVAATVVPLILLYWFKFSLTYIWRSTVGLGALAPISLLYLRSRFKESQLFQAEKLKTVERRYSLEILMKNYRSRLSAVSIIWFFYNFTAYPFGIFASAVISKIVEDGNLGETLAWNALLTTFYLPGALAGAFVSEWIGPRLALSVGSLTQSAIGFLIVFYLRTIVASTSMFIIIYGTFMAAGELGLGGNVKLLASQSCPTAIRGIFYCFAAAFGKFGAFVGTQLFPLLIYNENATVLGEMTSESAVEKLAKTPRTIASSEVLWGIQIAFLVCSCTGVLSSIIAFCYIPPATFDSVQEEDVRFRALLQQKKNEHYNSTYSQ